MTTTTSSPPNGGAITVHHTGPQNVMLAPETMERVLLGGDISGLNPAQKVSYLVKLCESLGLNHMTKPFEFTRLNGKEVVYAKKDCTEQLRTIHGISIEITRRETRDGIYEVTAKATNKAGRHDEDIGAVAVANLKGEALANATMKAVTKAKRRVTLSICGLGLLDESEIEDARDVTPPPPAGPPPPPPRSREEIKEELREDIKRQEQQSKAAAVDTVRRARLAQVWKLAQEKGLNESGFKTLAAATLGEPTPPSSNWTDAEITAVENAIRNKLGPDWIPEREPGAEG